MRFLPQELALSDPNLQLPDYNCPIPTAFQESIALVGELQRNFEKNHSTCSFLTISFVPKIPKVKKQQSKWDRNGMALSKVKPCVQTYVPWLSKKTKTTTYGSLFDVQ